MRRLVLALGAVALVVVNVAAARTDVGVDLSAAHRFTLSPETRSLVRAVRSPLRITAFLTESGPAARDARFLLDRYHDLNRRISYAVVDPDTHPGEARRLGVGKYSTVVLEHRGRRVDAPAVEELEISTGILRLLRGRTRTVCVLTGHGEASLTDESPDGLSKLADLMRHNAYDPREIDLAGGSGVPGDCDALVIAGSRDPFLAHETDAVNDYAKRAGRVAIFATPVTEGDPNPLLSPWGIQFTGGLVIDRTRSENLDFSNVIVEDLPSANPVDNGVSRLQMPATGGFIVEDHLRDGLTVARLARSSGQSFVESNPDTETTFDAGDLPGPVLVAVAADDSRIENTPDTRVRGGQARIARTRVVATGGDAWVRNRVIDNLSNRRFVGNALAWLTQEEQLLAAEARPETSRSLPFTPERQTQVLAVTVGVVPGVIVGLGVLQWAIARRRRR